MTDKDKHELIRRLSALPKTDRGISWQLRNYRDAEELSVYGETASCLKWILDNTEALISSLSPIAGKGDGWLPIGTVVEKVSGYKWPGVVVGHVETTVGERRYVVECTVPEVAGALHIYSPSQIAIPSNGERGR